jgi:lipoprotein NlpD
MHRFGVILLLTAFMVGCANPRMPAPVETRSVPKNVPTLQSASGESRSSSSSKVAPPSQGRAAVASSAPASPAAAASPSSSSATPPAASDRAAVDRVVTPGVQFAWPTPGKILTNFSDPGYKGIALAGKEGDPVLAASDGRVVYSGSGLRGYGNLVIVKHDGDFLTAYAHNKSIMVTEGQSVKRGQKIAELGMTDTDTPKLHFEVRRSGKPVDPIAYLPPR